MSYVYFFLILFVFIGIYRWATLKYRSIRLPQSDVLAKAFIRFPEMAGARVPLGVYVRVPSPKDPRIVTAKVILDGDEYDVLEVRVSEGSKNAWEVDLAWNPKPFGILRKEDRFRKGQA
jgi:hypothetical protein